MHGSRRRSTLGAHRAAAWEGIHIGVDQFGAVPDDHARQIGHKRADIVVLGALFSEELQIGTERRGSGL